MKKKDLIEEAIRLRDSEKLSLKAIASRLGVSKSTASLWLREHRLPDDLIDERRATYLRTDGHKRQISELGKKWGGSSKKPIDQLKGWTTIRRRILAERGRRCERCGWSEPNPYNGIVPVQVDHINGDPTDHRLENLIVLCPNCHSLTEHFMFYGRSHEGKWGQKGTRRLRVGKQAG